MSETNTALSMNKASVTSQAGHVVDQNISFFRDHIDAYNENVQTLETYRRIRAAINEAITGIKRLLDIGNGGVFDYETRLVKEIVALDLFLDQLPVKYRCPPNVVLRTGNALAIPEPDESYDGVLISMLLHHLVGRTVRESLENLRRVLHEAFRVLQTGGKLIIVESCVPRWFYRVEQVAFPLASFVIRKLSSHPATLQYPVSLIKHGVREFTSSVEVTRIPKGSWILQYGVRFPSILTPCCPYRLVARRL